MSYWPLFQKYGKNSHFWTKNGHILANFQKIKKNKGTLFSTTSKVQEKKVTLVFHNMAYWVRCGHFIKNMAKIEILDKIWPYLDQYPKNQKNKGTLFSSTFKVQEKKVTLVFHNMAS